METAFTAEQRAFLLQLLHQPSPSGWEAEGQNLWQKEAAKYADQVEQDAYGNTYATLKGRSADGPTLMIEAHADEIGFIVKYINDEGFLSLSPVGGSDKTIAAARKIHIFTEKGPVIGVLGNTAIHLRQKEKDKIPEWEDLFVDVGATSADEVKELGIRVGCPAVYTDGAIEVGENRIIGRALDNRLGGFALTRILEMVSQAERPQATLVFANAVQEELGCHGARMISHRINPDAAIVFDVTHATDTPGIDSRQHGKVKLGKGPTIAHGMSNQAQIVEMLESLSREHELPIQHEAISRSTSTDTDSVFITRDGIPSALISFPLRYMHSVTETIDLRDVETAVKLVAAFARSLVPGQTFSPRGVSLD